MPPEPIGQIKLSNEADLSSIRSQLTDAEYGEFQHWLALGEGGLPHTLEGFRTLQTLNRKLRNPLDSSRIAGLVGQQGDLATLRNLPGRTGTRPTIAPFAIPHRQLDQHNGPAVREQQRAMFDEVVEQERLFVHYEKSYFEKHNDAVFLNDKEQGNATVVNATHGEVGHMHPADGSMHFSLSPSDTKEVLEKGWGELHGLAGQVYGGNQALPATYTMVYSPRTESELTVTKQILRAAIRYSSLRAASPCSAP
jgi:hypothetical protein